MWMRLLRHSVLIVIAVSVVMSACVSFPELTVARSESPSIRITKKICDNSSFPVFVESHCYQDDSASFEIETPNLQHATTLRSGNQFKPSPELFAQGDMWRIIDTNESNHAPVTVLSCLQYRPGEDLMLGVAPVGNLRGLQRWDVWWTAADAGNGERYAPSLECIWFELPNVAEVPAVLSLQAFTSNGSYLYWTDAEHTGLGEFPRGESGEKLEANIVMSNLSNGEVYSFAADAYGQVLVPADDYVLQSTDTGYEGIVSMLPGATVLTEIGLGGTAPDSGTSPEIAEWGVIVQYCSANACLPVVGATVYYESLDGSTSGYCVTEATNAPAGPTGVCGFEFVWGVPVRLTLDTSTLPEGTVLVSANPIDYLVQENLGGDPAVPIFELGPA
ncbi:MAG TPA: hypothetical protein VGR29_03350 [Thermomicrobiales bacterium]|nr:hypothetical protein [Thermomicrobiales bacterium]